MHPLAAAGEIVCKLTTLYSLWPDKLDLHAEPLSMEAKASRTRETASLEK
jgi:hypothetical protein